LDACDIDYELVEPLSRDDSAQVLREAIAQGKTRFVAVGGDGTVNTLINDLLTATWEEPPVVGVLPGGTGCDLIRTFGMPQDMRSAALHLRGDQTYLIDVAQASGEWGTRRFVNVGQTGAAAAALERAMTLPSRLGASKYPVGLALALPSFRRTVVKVTTERRMIESDALAVIAANGQFFGGGFNIAPKATLVDGELDIQILSPSKRRAARLVPRIRKGMHLADRSVRRISAPWAVVETELPWPVELDGDPVGNTPVRFAVGPGRIALKI
jgi:YegS/Rv2252/BmrU family lipid kinase